MDNNKSKRIAKNTAMLYFRMLFTMAVGVYTSRIVLQQLGVDDFGIYNVVGGIVTMFSIVSASLSSAISRFLTFELGKGNSDKLNKVFSTAILIQLVIGLIVVVLVEAIGVWFLNYKMDITPDRLNAANWVLQCSLVTFIINMISLPYNAAIIAHEKMQAFAYISFIEAFLRLAVAFALYTSIFDSLKLYAILLTIAALIVRWVYGIYCNHNFKECHFRFRLDFKLIKEMLSFSSWNFIGSTSGILRDQGVNIVMNIFCGPAVNAARGIAVQVNSVINSFSNNFMIAVNPQIIKSYAANETDYMLSLVRQSARFSYYLLLLVSLPLIFEAPKVLSVWLTIVPEHTVNFVRLILILGMSEAISLPLQFANQATGKIKTYQLTVGGLQMLNFPISYLLLYLGYAPEATFILAIVISQICLCARLLILRKTIGISIRLFINKVYCNILIVTVFSILLPSIFIYHNNHTDILSFILTCFICIISTLIAIIFIGCSSNERTILFSKGKRILQSYFSRHA